MYLIWLGNGFTRMLSWLFDILKSTVSNYLVTWTNLLYSSLGKIVLWRSEVQVLDRMPETFKTPYSSTRCIIDWIEMFCQRPSLLLSHSAMCSNCKHHVTYKGLLGIEPSGAITFISELYKGVISAVSGILNKNPWNDNDSILGDRVFTIQNALAPWNVKLNIPSFLGDKAQLTEAEVKESQAIASMRSYVERATTIRILKIWIVFSRHYIVLLIKFGLFHVYYAISYHF